MAEKPPDYQQIEDTTKATKAMLGRLPDCVESREANRLLDVMAKLAYQAREKAKPEPVSVEGA